MKTPQSPAPVAGRPLTAETARADLQELVDLLLDSGETLIVGRGPANDYGNALSFILADHFRLSRPASEQPVEAIGAGREEIARIIRDRAQIGGTDWQRNACGADINAEELADLIAALSPASLAGPELTVWYGKMPESNGRENWTAELRRVHTIDKWDRGFCFARSEYPGRVLYEADRVRWIIGERAERPDILAYDADAHSGYVEPASPAPTPMGDKPEWLYLPEGEKPKDEGWQITHMTASSKEEGKRRIWVRNLTRSVLSAPTPMGGDVEALREAVEKIASEEEPELGNGNTNDLLARQFWTIATEALAAPPSVQPVEGK